MNAPGRRFSRRLLVLFFAALFPCGLAVLPPAQAQTTPGQTGPALQQSRVFNEDETAALLLRLSNCQKLGKREEAEEIVKGLAAAGPPAVNALVSALSHPDVEVARLAAETLGELRAAAAVRPLAEVLRNGRRPGTVEFTDKSGKKQSGIDLHELRAIYALRVEAAEALGAVGGEEAYRALADAFSSQDSFYVRIVGDSIPAADGKPFPLQEREFSRIILNAVAPAMVSVDEAASFEVFKLAIADGEPDFQWAGYYGLSFCRSTPEVLEILGELLGDRDAAIPLVSHFVEDLGLNRPYAGIKEFVADLLSMEKCRARVLGLEILLHKAKSGGAEAQALIADEELVKALREAMRDTCYDAAAMSSRVVHRLGLTADLLEALDKGDVETVAEYFYFYILTGDSRAEPLLVKMLDYHGTAEMCQVFMLSGNETLSAAGRAWLEDHGGSQIGGGGTGLSLETDTAWGAFLDEEDP